MCRTEAVDVPVLPDPVEDPKNDGAPEHRETAAPSMPSTTFLGIRGTVPGRFLSVSDISDLTKEFKQLLLRQPGTEIFYGGDYWAQRDYFQNMFHAVGLVAGREHGVHSLMGFEFGGRRGGNPEVVAQVLKALLRVLAEVVLAENTLFSVRFEQEDESNSSDQLLIPGEEEKVDSRRRAGRSLQALEQKVSARDFVRENQVPFWFRGPPGGCGGNTDLLLDLGSHGVIHVDLHGGHPWLLSMGDRAPMVPLLSMD